MGFSLHFTYYTCIPKKSWMIKDKVQKIQQLWKIIRAISYSLNISSFTFFKIKGCQLVFQDYGKPLPIVSLYRNLLRFQPVVKLCKFFHGASCSIANRLNGNSLDEKQEFIFFKTRLKFIFTYKILRTCFQYFTREILL